MTRKQLQALSVYARELADHLELRDWTLKLLAQPIGDDDGAMARIEPVYGRKLATLEFAHEFAEQAAHKVRHYVAHELIHLHVNQVWNAVDHGPVQSIVGRPAYEILSADLRERTELAVDALADAVASHLPLIDWTYRPDWCRGSARGDDIVVQPYRPAMQAVIDGS